jgi:hypothetical protein
VYRNYYIAFIAALILYGIQLLAKYAVISAPQWFVNYAADVLCIPVILAICLKFIRWIKRWPYFYLSKFQLLFAWAYTSAVFEFILPHYHQKFTSDWWDVLSYGIGTVVFYLCQKQLQRDENLKTI